MSRRDICGLCVVKTPEITESGLTQEHGGYHMGAPYCLMIFRHFGFILHEGKTKFTFGNDFRKNKKSSDN